VLLVVIRLRSKTSPTIYHATKFWVLNLQIAVGSCPWTDWRPFEIWLSITWKAPNFDHTYLGIPSVKSIGSFENILSFAYFKVLNLFKFRILKVPGTFHLKTPKNFRIFHYGSENLNQFVFMDSPIKLK
jgi:hypothetical protein